MFIKFCQSLIAGAFVAFSGPVSAQSSPFEIYIDADYSISSAAAQSIELGVRTALEEVNYQLAGVDVRIRPMDHRGNVKRSRRTLEQYLKNDAALAVFGGLHSPPYLAHKDFINEHGVLTLLPWSAAGPITRGSAGMENWIFRLSVDDAQAGDFFIQESIERNGCQNMAFILLETGWGRANQKTLTAALAQHGRDPALVEFFSAAISDSTALGLATRVKRAGADCAILLSNWDDGALVLNALFEVEAEVRIFSHWGVMGGEFTSHVSAQVRDALDLRVLQTCGLRREREGSAVLQNALARLEPAKATLSELAAPTGFVHGYDLTRVLIAAADQVAETEVWQTGSIQERRAVLRAALENLQAPVEGILDRYNPPFQPFTPGVLDAHEALGLEDLCVARFRTDGSLEDAH
ncbi:ABC transporter substrate-binding protein [Epibacterium sp. SM1969]|uniref:ABC transporter substrate-binding protein n=1 Tax=Tritonibacter aquimaris TaxID=2663379 RepID=A0A844B240_9RHOB|nr:ABC transporter substrate-binding protein [Tritonibacter aquimaris]MQY44422.1 ABC transporter substrate-binding protein [Tritonibacter aquimaris]